MLPSDSPPQCSGCGVYGSWPASGEIDIMEAVNDMNTAFATLHYGGPPNRKFSSYWTHGPGQYAGNPLTKVNAVALKTMDLSPLHSKQASVLRHAHDQQHAYFCLEGQNHIG